MICKVCNNNFEQAIKTIVCFGKEVTVESSCPFCEKKEKELAEQFLEEQAGLRRIARFKKCNIEPMYYDSDLNNFEASTQALQKAKNEVERLIAGEVKKIVMLGKNGAGKTHLAVCAVKALEGQIKTVYEIATEIRASYSQLAKSTELEIVEKYASLPLLVIDEIGRTKGSDAEVNWLSAIIDKRHVRMLPLILISNKHMLKHCTQNGCKDCLENYLGNDVMSRLAENAELLIFDGEDYRRKKRSKT